MNHLYIMPPILQSIEVFIILILYLVSVSLTYKDTELATDISVIFKYLSM